MERPLTQERALAILDAINALPWGWHSRTETINACMTPAERQALIDWVNNEQASCLAHALTEMTLTS